MPAALASSSMLVLRKPYAENCLCPCSRSLLRISSFSWSVKALGMLHLSFSVTIYYLWSQNHNTTKRPPDASGHSFCDNPVIIVHMLYLSVSLGRAKTLTNEEGAIRMISPNEANMDISVVICTNLTKIYEGGTVALQDLSLQIGRGTSFGLLGENGAGKSTLVRLVMGFILPT